MDCQRPKYSEKTDIWAFGCVLLEVARTGQRSAFKHDYEAQGYAKGDEQHSLPQLESDENPRLSQYQVDCLNWAIELCLKLKPEERPTAEYLYQTFLGWDWPS